MTEHPAPEEELDMPVLEGEVSPMHGYRGEPATLTGVPRALSIAVSREAGARGATIAKRVSTRLGWQLFSQDLLEYISQEGNCRQEILDSLSPAATEWVNYHLARQASNLSRNLSVLELARMVLSLGAHGEVVLLGRGAGCVLPERSTLHVRLVAPLPDRIAYTSQWMRLTEEEAAEQVRKQDHRRSEFVSTHFQRKPNDVHQYDLVLNSSMLGEETCADLIIHAANAKLAALLEGPEMP